MRLGRLLRLGRCFLNSVTDDSVDEMQRDEGRGRSLSKEPVLAKYVRRHHSADQIIGGKSEGTMTRSKLKSTCLLADFEPSNVKNALENDSWIEAMNEEIEQIEKNKTWTLVPRPKDKNPLGSNYVLVFRPGYKSPCLVFLYLLNFLIHSLNLTVIF